MKIKTFATFATCISAALLFSITLTAFAEDSSSSESSATLESSLDAAEESFEAPTEEATEESFEAPAEETTKESSSVEESTEETSTEETFAETRETAENAIDTENAMKITLTNGTAAEYTSLRVRASMTDEWSENIMADAQTWAAGESIEFYIPQEYSDSSLGLFDLLLTSSDGSETEVIFVPLLEDVSGRLYVQDGTALVEVQDERLVAESEYVSDTEIRQDYEAMKEALKESLIEEVNSQ